VRSDFSATRFQPVNLLRFDILHLLKEGTQISSETVENIKTKIIEKDEEYFSKYGDILVNALKIILKRRNLLSLIGREITVFSFHLFTLIQ